MFALPRDGGGTARSDGLSRDERLHGGHDRGLHVAARNPAATRQDPAARTRQRLERVSGSVRSATICASHPPSRTAASPMPANSRSCERARRRHRAARRQTPRARRLRRARTARRAGRRVVGGTRRRGDCLRGAPNTPGVKIINITSAPRAEDDRHYPVSREFSVPDCYVMFEDVFVPIGTRLPVRRDRVRRRHRGHVRRLGTRALGLRHGRSRGTRARPRADDRRDERRRQDRAHPQQALDDRGVGVDVPRRLGPRAREREDDAVRHGAARRLGRVRDEGVRRRTLQRHVELSARHLAARSC